MAVVLADNMNSCQDSWTEKMLLFLTARALKSNELPILFLSHELHHMNVEK